MRCTTKTFLRPALAAMAMALGVSIVAGCTGSDLNGAAPAAQSEQPVTAPRRQYTREDAAIQRASVFRKDRIAEGKRSGTWCWRRGLPGAITPGPIEAARQYGEHDSLLIREE